MAGLNIFFSSSKDFHENAKKVPNPKIGCTTAGEIDNKLCRQLVVKELNEKDFSTEIIKITDLETPIIHSKEISEKAAKLLKNKQNLICFVLNDGLSGAEEMIQSTLLVSLPKNTTIFGASSGDDLNFKDTFACINDDIFKGVIVLLIGTNLKFYLHKENLYKENGKHMIVTKAIGRTIYELDSKPAVTRYAEVVNADKGNIDSYFHSNPFGTYYNNDIFICSPQKSNSDKSISTYRTILPGTILWTLELDDYKKIMENTVDTILSKGTPIVTFTSNCILRKILFEQEACSSFVNNCLSKINAFGFTSYGEQYNGFHINQTMVTLTFYK